MTYSINDLKKLSMRLYDVFKTLGELLDAELFDHLIIVLSLKEKAICEIEKAYSCTSFLYHEKVKKHKHIPNPSRKRVRM